MADNIFSITPNDTNDPDGLKWLNSKTLIASKIFGLGCTTVVVSKNELVDILTDDAEDFRDLLCNHKEFVITTHNFLTRKFKFENDNYIVTCVYNAPTKVIDDLIESQEFIWGNLYLICRKNALTKIGNDLLTDIKELLTKSTFLEMPSIKSELLASTSDGSELLWFNPSTDIGAN